MAEEEVEPEDFLAEDRDMQEREETIMEVVNSIFSRVFARAEDADLQASVPAFTVNRLLKNALEVVEMSFVPREDHAIESYMNSGNNWIIDHEPVPAPIDRWARGAVPTRRKTKVAEPINSERSLLRRPSHLSSGARRSTSVSSVHSNSLTQNTGGRTRNAVPARPGVPKRNEGGVPRKHLTAEEAEREQRLRDEIESRRQAEELQRLQAEKDEEEVRRLEVLQKELRGKDYGYDHKGNVIVLSKVDPEKLPSYSVGPKVALLPTEEELALMELEALKDREGKLRKSSVGLPDEKKKKKKDKKPTEIEYVQQTVEGQPSMMETMKMSSGVTLREGNSVKPGPRVGPVTDRISRRDFMSKIGSQDGYGGAEIARVKTPASPENEAGQLDGGVPSNAMDMEGGLDWTLDATPIEPPPPPAPASPPDVSEFLVSAPDWGINPPPRDRPYEPPSQPPKVSERHRELALGKVSRQPRDRPFVATSKKDKALDPNFPTVRNPNTLLQPVEQAAN